MAQSECCSSLKILICRFLEIAVAIVLFDKHLIPKLYLHTVKVSHFSQDNCVMVFMRRLLPLLPLPTRQAGLACNR